MRRSLALVALFVLAAFAQVDPATHATEPCRPGESKSVATRADTVCFRQFKNDLAFVVTANDVSVMRLSHYEFSNNATGLGTVTSRALECASQGCTAMEACTVIGTSLYVAVTLSDDYVHAFVRATYNVATNKIEFTHSDLFGANLYAPHPHLQMRLRSMDYHPERRSLLAITHTITTPLKTPYLFEYPIDFDGNVGTPTVHAELELFPFLPVQFNFSGAAGTTLDVLPDGSVLISIANFPTNQYQSYDFGAPLLIGLPSDFTSLIDFDHNDYFMITAEAVNVTQHTCVNTRYNGVAFAYTVSHSFYTHELFLTVANGRMALAGQTAPNAAHASFSTRPGACAWSPDSRSLFRFYHSGLANSGFRISGGTWGIHLAIPDGVEPSTTSSQFLYETQSSTQIDPLRRQRSADEPKLPAVGHHLTFEAGTQVSLETIVRYNAQFNYTIESPEFFVEWRALQGYDRTEDADALHSRVLALADTSRVSKRIAYGAPVMTDTEAPWMCRSAGPLSVCTCAILDAWHVILPAHCVPLGNNTILYTPFWVVTGSRQTDPSAPGTSITLARRVATHPSTLSNLDIPDYADVAVMKLDSALPLSATRQPIAYAKTPARSQPNEPVRIYGWGRDELNNVPSSLRKMSGHVTTPDTWSSPYRYIALNGTTIHTGVRPGDSGASVVTDDGLLIGLINGFRGLNDEWPLSIAVELSQVAPWLDARNSFVYSQTAPHEYVRHGEVGKVARYTRYDEMTRQNTNVFVGPVNAMKMNGTGNDHVNLMAGVTLQYSPENTMVCGDFVKIRGEPTPLDDCSVPHGSATSCQFCGCSTRRAPRQIAEEAVLCSASSTNGVYAVSRRGVKFLDTARVERSISIEAMASKIGTTAGSFEILRMTQACAAYDGNRVRVTAETNLEGLRWVVFTLDESLAVAGEQLFFDPRLIDESWNVEDLTTMAFREGGTTVFIGTTPTYGLNIPLVIAIGASNNGYSGDVLMYVFTLDLEALGATSAGRSVQSLSYSPANDRLALQLDGSVGLSEPRYMMLYVNCDFFSAGALDFVYFDFDPLTRPFLSAVQTVTPWKNGFFVSVYSTEPTEGAYMCLYTLDGDDMGLDVWALDTLFAEDNEIQHSTSILDGAKRFLHSSWKSTLDARPRVVSLRVPDTTAKAGTLIYHDDSMDDACTIVRPPSSLARSLENVQRKKRVTGTTLKYVCNPECIRTSSYCPTSCRLYGSGATGTIGTVTGGSDKNATANFAYQPADDWIAPQATQAPTETHGARKVKSHARSTRSAESCATTDNRIGIVQPYLSRSRSVLTFANVDPASTLLYNRELSLRQEDTCDGFESDFETLPPSSKKSLGGGELAAIIIVPLVVIGAVLTLAIIIALRESPTKQSTGKTSRRASTNSSVEKPLLDETTPLSSAAASFSPMHYNSTITPLMSQATTAGIAQGILRARGKAM